MATSPGLVLQPYYFPYAALAATVEKPDAAHAGMACSRIHTASKRNTLAEFSTLLTEILQGADQPARSPVETARRGPREAPPLSQTRRTLWPANRLPLYLPL